MLQINDGGLCVTDPILKTACLLKIYKINKNLVSYELRYSQA